MRCVTPRKGLSLLEVVVATTILLSAMVGLGHLIVSAGQRAVEVQHKSEAARLCQSKMAEVLVGALPLQNEADIAFEEAPEWQWALQCEQGAAVGLWLVSVRVYREQPNGSRIESILSRMVLDPSLRGSNQDMALISGTDAAAAGTDMGAGGMPTSGTPAGGP